MFELCFNSISGVFQECFKSVSRVVELSHDVRDILEKAGGNFKKKNNSVSKVFHECFMNVSNLFFCMQVIAATRA